MAAVWLPSVTLTVPPPAGIACVATACVGGSDGVVLLLPPPPPPPHAARTQVVTQINKMRGNRKTAVPSRYRDVPRKPAYKGSLTHSSGSFERLAIQV